MAITLVRDNTLRISISKNQRLIKMVRKVRKNKNGVPRKKPSKRRVKKGEKAFRGKDGKLRKK